MNFQHAPMDINSWTRMTLCSHLGIQIPWQLEIMQKIGHGNSIFFDATFGTNQCRVHHFCYCMKCPMINVFHNIVINVGSMFFAVPFVHPNGVWWMAKWDTSCINVIGKSWENDLDLVLEHYQNICQAIGCLMLSLLTMLKLNQCIEIWFPKIYLL